MVLADNWAILFPSKKDSFACVCALLLMAAENNTPLATEVGSFGLVFRSSKSLQP